MYSEPLIIATTHSLRPCPRHVNYDSHPTSDRFDCAWFVGSSPARSDTGKRQRDVNIYIPLDLINERDFSNIDIEKYFIKVMQII